MIYQETDGRGRLHSEYERVFELWNISTEEIETTRVMTLADATERNKMLQAKADPRRWIAGR